MEHNSDARFRVIIASPGGRGGRGGIASLVRYLADALPEKLPDLEIDVLDTYGPGAFWAMPIGFFAAVLRLITRRLSGRVDLLHIHMAHYGSAFRKAVLAAIAHTMHLPTIMHVHGSQFDDFFRGLNPVGRDLLTAVLRRCTRVVVLGSYWRDFMIREVGLDAHRVKLVQNGVPSVSIRSHKETPEAPALLMLGELGTRKGTPELIEALASSELRHRKWTATLAGNGAVDQYRASVASLGLSGRITLPGWQSADQVRELLHSADMLILPSHHEGLPMAILEAMAAGVTVISTPVGAVPDAIVDGETGLLVTPGDPVALAGAILRLLDDVPLRRALAANARGRFEQMFTIDQTASAIASIYCELRPRGATDTGAV